MILIADSGSTKTHWCMVHPDGSQQFIETEGYNPYYVNSDYITRSLSNVFSKQVNPDQIYFYGSGCFADTIPVIDQALRQVFPNAVNYIEMDLLGAARSLLGRLPGFAAILGTGTNSCLYDGHQITNNIDSLGFILGDEGSGTALGKALLGDYIRGYMPAEEAALFRETFTLDKEQIFQKVYGGPLANRFCSSFCPFIAQHIHRSYFSQLTRRCFTALFTNLVSQYPNYQQYGFNSIGSVGFIFAGPLKEVALEFGMQPGLIVRSPMEGLIAYHTDRH